MRNKISKILVVIAALLFLLQGANYVAKRSGPLPQVPQPNGYETLLQTASQVSLPAHDITETTEAEVRKVSEINRQPLSQAREALTKQIAVPLNTKPGYVEAHAAEVKELKKLGVAMGLQCRAELLAGNTNAAAAYLLDMVRLGQAIKRGGVISDAIHGMAVESVGSSSLRGLIPTLDGSFAKDFAQTLENAESKRQPAEEIIQTENNWSHASFGLISRLGSLSKKNHEQRRAQFLENYHKNADRTRRLTFLLAARAYEVSSGKRPANPSDVVPAILTKVPVGSETQAPLPDLLSAK